jgi:hypothetical protein
MREATAIDIEGLVKGYPRGTAWHCTFYTPAGFNVSSSPQRINGKLKDVQERLLI